MAELESRIDRFAFEREQGEYAFVDATQGLVPGKALERLDPQAELP